MCYIPNRMVCKTLASIALCHVSEQKKERVCIAEIPTITRSVQSTQWYRQENIQNPHLSPSCVCSRLDCGAGPTQAHSISNCLAEVRAVGVL
jgi:hypothetical protein